MKDVIAFILLFSVAFMLPYCLLGVRVGWTETSIVYGISIIAGGATLMAFCLLTMGKDK